VLHNSCCSRFTRRSGRLAVYAAWSDAPFSPKLFTTVPVAMALVRALAATLLKRSSRSLGGSIVTRLKLAPTVLAITPREYFSYSIGVRRSLR